MDLTGFKPDVSKTRQHSMKSQCAYLGNEAMPVANLADRYLEAINMLNREDITSPKIDTWLRARLERWLVKKLRSVGTKKGKRSKVSEEFFIDCIRREQLTKIAFRSVDSFSEERWAICPEDAPMSRFSLLLRDREALTAEISIEAIRHRLYKLWRKGVIHSDTGSEFFKSYWIDDDVMRRAFDFAKAFWETKGLSKPTLSDTLHLKTIKVFKMRRLREELQEALSKSFLTFSQDERWQNFAYSVLKSTLEKK